MKKMRLPAAWLALPWIVACNFVPPGGSGTGNTLGSDGGSADEGTSDGTGTSTIGDSTTTEPAATDEGDETSCPPGTLGCPCDADACADDLVCVQGDCQPGSCGDGVRDDDEACDDENLDDGDGCEHDCTVSEGARKVVTGNAHTCVLLWDGHVRCWGSGDQGRLGYGNTANVGNELQPWEVGDVPLGGDVVVDLSAGGNFTCALFEDGRVRCWGDGANGRLGNGVTDYGDDEPASASPSIDLGGPAVAIASGLTHSCAIREDRSVVCWGEGGQGRLGYGNQDDIGDGETPASIGAVDVGGDVAAVAAGEAHTCALLGDATLRCWGSGAAGRLGYGDSANVGDSGTPAEAGPVPLDEDVERIAAAGGHTCAIVVGGDVRCWGLNDVGQLGDGSGSNQGDAMEETPTDLQNLEIGGTAIELALGTSHTCVVLEDGAIKCWGEGASGRLGYGGETDVDVPPDMPVEVSMRHAVVAADAGFAHTCARLQDGNLRCWGLNDNGQLGYGNTNDVADERGETPQSIGDVPFLP